MASSHGASEARDEPTPSTKTAVVPAGTSTAPSRPRSTHAGGRNDTASPRETGSRTPSTSRPSQSKNPWCHAMSSVCTTTAPGVAAASRPAAVDFPPALRPSTATTSGPVRVGPARRARASSTSRPATSRVVSAAHGPRSGSSSATRILGSRPVPEAPAALRLQYACRAGTVFRSGTAHLANLLAEAGVPADPAALVRRPAQLRHRGRRGHGPGAARPRAVRERGGHADGVRARPRRRRSVLTQTAGLPSAATAARSRSAGSSAW